MEAIKILALILMCGAPVTLGFVLGAWWKSKQDRGLADRLEAVEAFIRQRFGSEQGGR